jgi:hypothetical protein
MSEVQLTPTARLILHALADNEYHSIPHLKRETGTKSTICISGALNVLQVMGKVRRSDDAPGGFWRLEPQPWSELREKEIARQVADAHRKRLLDAEVHYPASLTPAAWVELGFDDLAEEAEARLDAAFKAAFAIELDKAEEIAGQVASGVLTDAEVDIQGIPLAFAGLAVRYSECNASQRPGVACLGVFFVCEPPSLT